MDKIFLQDKFPPSQSSPDLQPYTITECELNPLWSLGELYIFILNFLTIFSGEWTVSLWALEGSELLPTIK